MEILFGYLIAASIEYLVVFFAVYVAVCNISHIVGRSWMLISLTEDIKVEFYEINEAAKSKQKRSQVLIKLFDLIQFHSSAKQLSAN